MKLLTSDKKHHYKQIAGIAFSVLLALLFLYIAFRGVDFSKVMSILSGASWIWIIVLSISLLTAHYLRALRWKVILHSVKPDTSVVNLFGSLMVGYGVNCVIPRLGEVSRAVLLGRWENISKTSLIGTVIVERVIDMLGLGLALLASVFIYSGNLYESFPWLKSTLYITAFMMFFLILTLVLIVRMKERFYNIIVKLAGKVSDKLAKKLAYIFEMLVLGFSSLKGTRNYLLTLGLSLLIIFGYGLNSYIGFYTLGMQNILPVSYGMAWIMMSISSIGVVIPTPGATGSYHTLAKSVLVLLFGFGEAISLAYAVITHIVSYVLFIVSALVLFFWLNNKYAKRIGNKVGLISFIETNMEQI